MSTITKSQDASYADTEMQEIAVMHLDVVSGGKVKPPQVTVAVSGTGNTSGGGSVTGTVTFTFGK